jgi:hypothetical protein
MRALAPEKLAILEPCMGSFWTRCLSLAPNLHTIHQDAATTYIPAELISSDVRKIMQEADMDGVS